MQIDMHHYGTYALARAAGFEREAALIVATSAQFVDDNIAESHLTFGDGSRIDTEATAHHLYDCDNLDEHNQRKVWVPFHFLPGNVGETYTERLKCRMDSEIAREMCDHHLAYSDRDFALHLLGIAAHVYADTFSHYGFSGVSSRGNKVDNSSFSYQEEVEGVGDTITPLSPEMRSYVTGKVGLFFEKRGEHGGLGTNIKTWLAEEFSGALGHGSVATLPDRPYLAWSFDYENPDAVAGVRDTRNNPVTYLASCRALHNMFRRFARLRPDVVGSKCLDFEAFAPRVKGILQTQGNKLERVDAWKNAAQSGELLGGDGEEIPEYEGNNWNEQWERLNENECYQSAMDTPIWRFYQAASLHRTFVLRDLLPKHGLIVD